MGKVQSGIATGQNMRTIAGDPQGKHSRSWRLPSLLPAAILLTVSVCWAQLANTGTLSGTITDSTGASIPGASVLIANAETGVQTSTVTNADGSFMMPGLQVGTYTVTVSKGGFQTFTEKGLAIHPATVTTVNVVMKLEAVSTEVTVSAAPEQVQVATPEVSNLVSGEQAATLPLNGRNYQSLSALMPGVVNTTPDTALGSGGRTTRNVMSVNGMGTSATLYTLDGIWNMNTGNMAQTTITPHPDSIDEVRVLQSNYEPRYSLMGASVVMLQTKSGTNTFHGTAFEYLRNDNLDSRNFFSPTLSPLHQNIFGYTLGGPFYVPHHYNAAKKKTFFFWSQQWTVQHIGSVLRGATPTNDMRNGIFGHAITNPQSGQPFSQIAPGQYQIPSGMIKPDSLALVNALAPPPNNPAGGFLNYLNLSPQINDQRDDEIKVDHNFRESLRLTAEYLDERQTSKNPNLPALGAGNVFPTQQEIDLTRNQLGQLQLAWIVSPSMTNTASVSMNNYVLDLTVAGITQRSQIPDFHEVLPFSGFGSDRLPAISFSQGWPSLGLPISRPLFHASDLEDTISDDWAWLRGNHSIEAGTQIIFGTKRQNAFAGAANGSWSFTGQFTGDAIADFLIGDAASFTQASTSPRPYMHYTIVSPYVQDRWKVRRNLTVTGGVRLEFLPIPHAQHAYESSFDPSRYNPQAAPIVNSNGTITPSPGFNPLNGLIINSVAGVPLNFSTRHQLFLAPEVGFAWDVFGDGKTSLRGGYGLTYTRTPFGDDCSYNCSLNPPLVQSLTLVTPSFPDPIGAAPRPPGAPTLFSQDLEYRPAQIHTYSLSLEHQFGQNWLASIAGAGNIGRHIPQTWNTNQPLPDPPFAYNPVINSGAVFTYVFAPFLGYGAIQNSTSNGNSYWDALEIGVRHRMGQNLVLTSAYTWSHTLAQQIVDVYHPGAYYGNSGVNVPQVLTLGWIYNLPWYRRQPGWRGAALGGWRYSGIFTAQSGFSLNPGLSISHQGLAVFPDRLPGTSTQGPKTAQQWFNKAAFQAPAAGFFGNAAPGSLAGPGVVNFDMALYKDFSIKEHQTIEFRSEFFNTLNHTNFNGIAAGVGSRNYGQVTSARDPRILEFALRYHF